jgi:hypothetical protein
MLRREGSQQRGGEGWREKKKRMKDTKKEGDEREENLFEDREEDGC